MTHTHLMLSPRDGLFLKDARGWYTSDIGRSHGHAWPLPPTVRGALRNAYGHAWMRRHNQRLEPAEWERESREVTIDALLALRLPLGAEPAPAHRLWPVPADAMYIQNPERNHHIHRLNPTPPDASVGFLDPPEITALWRAHGPANGKPRIPPDFWPESSMMRWLRGENVTNEPGHDLPRRIDMHVTIDSHTEAATQSMLFSTQITEPLSRQRPTGAESDGASFYEWTMALRCQIPQGLTLHGPLTVGGRRRLTRMRDASENLFAPPGDLGGDSPGLRLILATPAEFSYGWLPDGFTPRGDPPRYCGTLPGIDGEVVLCAAMVRRPLDLSTWDMVKREPRKTRRLARAGSVYFFHKVNNAAFTASERRRLWLATMGQGQEDGLGLILPGCWDCKGV